MKGFFSLLWFLLFSFSSYTRGTKQYNRETYIIDEPQGFFSKLDSDSLSEKSIWNHKFTYLSKRNLIPTSDEYVNDGSDAGDLEKRSSIPLPDLYHGEYYVDANVNLLKRGDVPEEYVVKDGQNDVTTVIDIKHSDIAKVEAANMQAASVQDASSADDNTQNEGDGSQDGSVGQDAALQDSTLKDALVPDESSAQDVTDKPKLQDAPDNKSEESADRESTESGSGDINTKREAVTPTLPTSVEVEQGADSGSGSIEENTPAASGAQPQVYASGSAWITHDIDESGSGAETASLIQPKVVPEGIIVDDTETVNLNKVIASSDSEPVVKKNSIPIDSPNKRQYISRPKFVVRNGYVYMKAPPLTQKTIVTTHIPRPPMVMPYDRFIHSYRRGGDRGYGFGRRSRYMVTPEQRYGMEGAEDNYEDDRAEDSHCDGDPCMNGATCNEVRDGYECICPTGFKGTDCEEEDKCHPNPCHNSGVCTEANGQYVCTCAEGFKGGNCQETNRCQPNPCRNGATCNEVSNDYECLCQPEFMGKDCSEINHCHMTPCLNGGTCTASLGISYAGLISCLCQPGYSGTRCELRDRCHINPCKNGGMCHDGICSCIGGYAGELCETPPSPCALSTCLNGGTCIAKGLTNYKCVCRHGFRGANCEDESRCEPNPCLNTGVCMDQEEGYKCDCRHNFKGTHCEDEVSPCDTNPCLNDGNCIVEYTKYKCLCRAGYKGVNCEDVDRCHHHPCKNGGTCTVNDDTVHCECVIGFKGLLCDDTDHCSPTPCHNNGICYENAESFTCQCNGGFKGQHCTDRDACHINPCNHQGVCIPQGSDYHCECTSGWSGKSCDIQDKCHPSPCLHGGICISRAPEEYECHCPSGFAGIDCEVEGFPVVREDKCHPSPCLNGGICISRVPTEYVCHCPSGFTGVDCKGEGYPGEIHHYEQPQQQPLPHHYEDHLPPLPCRNTHYGCCPDGETAANAPNGGGCPALRHEGLPIEEEPIILRDRDDARREDFRHIEVYHPPHPESQAAEAAARRSRYYWSRNW